MQITKNSMSVLRFSFWVVFAVMMTAMFGMGVHGHTIATVCAALIFFAAPVLGSRCKGVTNVSR